MNIKILLLLSCICAMAFVGNTAQAVKCSVNDLHAAVNKCYSEQELAQLRQELFQRIPSQRVRAYINECIGNRLDALEAFERFSKDAENDNN